MSEEKRPAGRPTLYREAVAQKIIELAKQGKTEKEIAEIIGIHPETIRLWKHKFDEFNWGLKEAKQIADDMVEAALFKKAIGMKYETQKVCSYEGSHEVVDYVETIPPDTTAAIFWLKNRRPEEWRDKQDIEHSGGVAITAKDVLEIMEKGLHKK